MGVLTNPKYEYFAQEVAKGINCSEAYQKAGFKEHPTNGYRLKNSERIRSRIEEILNKREEKFLRADVQAANAAAVDRKWVLQELIGLASEARNAGDRGAAARSLELVGKEMGMFIQRTEIGAPGDFANLDSNNAILDAVALELGAETAASLRAIISPQQAQQPMKTIEHDTKEVIEHQSRDCDDQ